MIDCEDCQFSSLTDTTLLTTSIVFPTPQKDDNSLSGSIPTEIGSLTSLTYLGFSKCDDNRVVHSDYGDLVPLMN